MATGVVINTATVEDLLRRLVLLQSQLLEKGSSDLETSPDQTDIQASAATEVP